MRFALLLALTLAAAGCASSPHNEPTLYQRLGGREAINVVVVDAMGNVSADQRINARFAHIDANNLSNNLVDLICERTGGP